ncbi:MAG: tripartite tricarboxylate transporter substrate-binding protein [Halofilum sp. (in: g-proteobacteria)]
MPVRSMGKGVVTGVVMAASLAVAPISAAQDRFSPSQPVEVVIPAGSGGGADQIARLLVQLIDEMNVSSYPFVPVNKAGESGAEALNYMTGESDPDHTVMVTLNSFYTTPIIVEGLDADPLAFTPVGLMGIDTFLLWVPNTSAYENVTDLESYVDTVKATDNWIMGGTGMGQEDSILTAMIEAEFDLDVAYQPYPGGGTVAENLVRQKIDSTVNNPAEQIDYWRAQMSRPVVQFTDERQALFPDVPTAQEVGHDVVYYMQRSINGSPSMSAEAQQWYIDVFRRIFESDGWQSYCSGEGMNCDEWVAGPQLAQFHEDNLSRHEQLIDQVGADAISGN